MWLIKNPERNPASFVDRQLSMYFFFYIITWEIKKKNKIVHKELNHSRSAFGPQSTSMVRSLPEYQAPKCNINVQKEKSLAL